jgi:Ca2+-binding RTX toxin-like protein
MVGGYGDVSLSVSTGTDTADGGAGDDVIRSLDDGWDDDVLTGGDGADRFAFHPGFGFDSITDFEAGSDLIDLNAYGQGWIYADLTFQASLLDPADAVVILPTGEYVLLDSFAVAELDAADFVL